MTSYELIFNQNKQIARLFEDVSKKLSAIVPRTMTSGAVLTRAVTRDAAAGRR
ncbi:MAG: hypothetical protein J0M28_15175 [Thauera sp.]|nr:hypothetical protein [Thauera sp.]